MIVTCPVCATRQQAGTPACDTCGAAWVEGTSREIVKLGYEQAETIPFIDADIEVNRLTRAVRNNSEQAKAARARTRRELRAFAALAFAVTLPLAMLFVSPERVVAAVPGMADVYGKLGYQINLRGLAFRDVKPQLMDADGTRVFAVRGLVENVSKVERRIPAIRFALFAKGREIYTWQLPATSRALKPGESTGFLTRLAAPPENADDLEIRFAREDEIGSNAAP
jgi:hypothetical protein